MNAMLCAALILLGANAFEQEFQAANTAYEAGKFNEAIADYERVVASGAAQAGVFYNLGNAYYKAGRLGPAIANYERAVAIAPGFSEARENLDKAIGETANRLPKPLRPAWQQALLFWDTGLTYAASRSLSLLAWLAFWALLAVALVRRVPYARAIAVLLCAIATLSGLSAWCKAHPVQLAVGIVPADTSAAAADPAQAAAGDPKQKGAPVRYGMSDTDTIRFHLAEGDRVAVEESRDGWARVRSVDGVRGWIREDQVCFVGPPYTPAPQPRQKEAP